MDFFLPFRSVWPKEAGLFESYDVNRLVDPSFVQSAIDRGLNK